MYHPIHLLTTSAPSETLQGTETKAAEATLVHTSIQTFSHLASATFEGCPVGHFLVFGRNPNLLSRNALLTIPWTQIQLFVHVPRAPLKGTTETQRSGIFAKQLLGTQHDT